MGHRNGLSRNDDGLKSELLVHFHIHFSSRPVLAHLPDRDLTELTSRTWRPTDFFDIFERTKFFLDEKEKTKWIYSFQVPRGRVEYAQVEAEYGLQRAGEEQYLQRTGTLNGLLHRWTVTDWRGNSVISPIGLI
jgi:hypothetical protein